MPLPLDLISTLSVRLEELKGQIYALHVENLRLRTFEISLSSHLKKEKERPQRILTDAGSAVRCHRLHSSLTKCITFYVLPQFRSHFIIDCPFPNAGHALALSALFPHLLKLPSRSLRISTVHALKLP